MISKVKDFYMFGNYVLFGKQNLSQVNKLPCLHPNQIQTARNIKSAFRFAIPGNSIPAGVLFAVKQTSNLLTQ